MNKSTKTKIIFITSITIVIAVLLFTFTIHFRTSQTSKDSYPNYLKTAIDNSVNLTREYQDEIGLWNSHFYNNAKMANITETYLPQFKKQLNQFNNTNAPAKYSQVKENYVKSFSNEIKSYEFFKDYLITNNSTANELSNEYFTAALNNESIARNAYTAAVNNNSR
jgi:hypothetical protein